MEEEKSENPWGQETPKVAEANEGEQPPKESVVENPEVQKESEREVRIKRILSLSWDTFKKNAKFLLILMVAYFLVRIFEGTVQNLGRDNSGLRIIFAILFAALNIFIAIGIIQIFLKISRGGEAKVLELIGDYKYFWKFLGATLLYVLIVLVGYLLLIIPGIIWQYKYSYYAYLIVDKEMGIVDSLKESGKITYGYKWKLFQMQLLMIPIFLLGILCLGVGIFVSIIVATFMTTYFYRILVGEKIYN